MPEQALMLRRRTVLGLLAALPASVWASGSPGSALVTAARRQIGVTKSYDNGYHPIAYPGGDVPRSTGVCADVVVRAARDAWGVDLQRLVHEDMARAFAIYPSHWGLSAPDSNIDHRRVPNLETYLTRQGARIWQADHWNSGAFFPRTLAIGDILTWRCFPTGGPHIAIVSDVGAWPRIIQNHGMGAREDFLLTAWLDAAHAQFRWRPALER